MKFLFDCGTRDPLASAGIFVLRVSIGAMMAIGHGWGKLVKFQDGVQGFPRPAIWPLSQMSHEVSKAFAVFAELGCGALLVLGLATRPAAFMLGFTMVVAAFQIHASGPWFLPGAGAKEPALLYLAVCLTLIFTGAGNYSLDRALGPGGKKKRW